MSLGIRTRAAASRTRTSSGTRESKGVTVVAASGNDGRLERYYPGALPGVLAVGAADATVGRAVHSYGAQVGIVAPGMNI